MSDSQPEGSITGYRYTAHNYAIGGGYESYDFDTIWLPSEQLQLDDRGAIDITSTPLTSNEESRAIDNYLKQQNFQDAEYRRINDEAKLKAYQEVQIAREPIAQATELLAKKNVLKEQIKSIDDDIEKLIKSLFRDK